MKRWIKAATRPQIASHIMNEYQKAGCTNVSVIDQTDTYCVVGMNLPSGRWTTCTMWYDNHPVKNGSATQTSLQSWKPTYRVTSSGDVYDGNNYVGTAMVRAVVGQKQNTRKNFQISSIRTDSGDVIIDHPSKANNYALVVQTLENRKITQRS